MAACFCPLRTVWWCASGRGPESRRLPRGADLYGGDRRSPIGVLGFLESRRPRRCADLYGGDRRSPTRCAGLPGEPSSSTGCRPLRRRPPLSNALCWAPGEPSSSTVCRLLRRRPPLSNALCWVSWRGDVYSGLGVDVGMATFSPWCFDGRCGPRALGTSPLQDLTSTFPHLAHFLHFSSFLLVAVSPDLLVCAVGMAFA